MVTALFIDEKYLKEFTPLAANLDMAMIFPHVAAFQDSFIQDILGSSLYDTLQARVIANNPSTTPLGGEAGLLDLCRSALAWGTVAKMLPFISIQIRNQGTIQTTTDNGTVASLEQIKYLKNECQSQYEFYAKRLTDFLLFHGSIFPDYVQFDPTRLIPRMRAPYDSGLYLGPSQDGGPFDTKESLHDFWRRYIV